MNVKKIDIGLESRKGKHSFGLHEGQERRYRPKELSLGVDPPSVCIGSRCNLNSSRQILILIIKVHNSNSKGEKVTFYSSNQMDTI